MDTKLELKFKTLKQILSKIDNALIAFSGGVDSSLLLKLASLALGDRVLAVIATSATYPAKELKHAKQFAKSLGVRVKIIHSQELNNPKYIANPPNRCYHCKSELFKRLRKIAQREKIKYLFDGSNLDDKNDFRPGAKAKKEFKVRSPLAEALFTKQDIRILSKHLGLQTWDKPPLACLASRIPYGEKIKVSDLRRIDKAEDFIKKLGFKQVRLRHYKTLARIEVEEHELRRLMSEGLRDKIIDRLKKLGYNYVTVDLEGYRTGSLNPVRNSQIN